MEVGVGCNPTNKLCRVTLNDTYAVQGNGDTLKTQATAMVDAHGDNSAQGTLTKTYSSDTYTQKMAGVATDVNGCAGAAQTSSATNGTASTCGATPVTVNIGPNKSAGPCVDAPVCLRRATRSVNYNQTCVRTFPLTGYNCSFKIPQLECMTQKTLATGATTNSCQATELTDAVLVSSTSATPTCTASDATGKCLTQTYSDYYTLPKKVTIDGGCVAAPFPLAGPVTDSCLNHGNGTSTSCKDGGWYRRTLTDSQCTSITTNNLGGGNVTQIIASLTEKEKAGCGVCINTMTSDTCYAKPTQAEPADTCANIDVSSCKLTSSVPESQFNGMTISQQENYSCQKQEDSCVEFDRTNLCSNAIATFGTDKPTIINPSSDGSLSKAMTSAAVVDAIAQGTQEGADPFVPRIFAGDDMRCTKPVGWFSGISANDCCRLGLDRPGGSGIQNKCSLAEVKLATSRRSNFAAYIGEYCSHKSGFAFFRHCDTRTQTYCTYKGILPRVIQTQGRIQLTDLASSSASETIQKARLNYKFYEGSGAWAAPTTVNGVTVTPWQYPSYCASYEATTAAYAASPTAKECPLALTQWFAVCENPNGCGALPEIPQLGSQFWTLSTINPLKNRTSAVSKFAMVTGACDPASTMCDYEVAAWPAGIGGRAISTKDMSFPLYSNQEQVTKALAGVPQDITALGDFIFRPNAVPGAATVGGPMPATVMLDYSVNGGQTFEHLALPTNVTGTDFSIPNVPDVRISGGCDQASNVCKYTITGTVTVTAKPWGSAENPDCTGFTIGQLSVLDFSKMDLSEWIASVTAKLQNSSTVSMGALASQRTQDLLRARSTGTATITASNPTNNQSARITPNEDFGPFTATLRVVGNWPVTYEDASKNVDPVTSAEVDWGDCTAGDRAAPAQETVGGVPSSGFLVSHQYAQPDQISPACGGGRNNIEHQAKVRVYSTSGVHNLTIKVNNAWTDYVGAPGSGGGNGNQTVTVPAPGK